MTKKTDSRDQRRKRRILIVDDSKIDRMIAHEALDGAGFTVLDAEDGTQGLSLFAEQQPDMVLLDLVMPEIDGFEVCRRLRDSALGAHTPVIIMTSFDDVDSINKAYHCGATDFVVKPFHPALLTHRVRYAFRNAETTEALRQSQERLANAQRAAKLGYWQWDPSIDIIEWSEEVSRIFGLPVAAHKTSLDEFLSYIHPDDRSSVEQAIQRVRTNRSKRGYRIEHRIKRANKSLRFVRHEALWREQVLSGFMQDITNLRLAEERIHQLAYYDAVTGLPNRSHLQENLGAMLSRAKRYAHWTALLFIDLDHFKEVNDNYGHSTGDALLKEVAKRLNICVRSHDAVVRAIPSDTNKPNSSDTVVRLGGDEFVIVAGEINRKSDAANLCERVLATLAKPFHCAAQPIGITASIGVSLYPGDGEDLDTLLRYADQAMYRAKERGRNNYCFYQTTE